MFPLRRGEGTDSCPPSCAPKDAGRERRTVMSGSTGKRLAPRGGIFATSSAVSLATFLSLETLMRRLEPPFVTGARPGTVSRSPRATHPCGWEREMAERDEELRLALASGEPAAASAAAFSQWESFLSAGLSAMRAGGPAPRRRPRGPCRNHHGRNPRRLLAVDHQEGDASHAQQPGRGPCPSFVPARLEPPEGLTRTVLFSTVRL